MISLKQESESSPRCVTCVYAAHDVFGERVYCYGKIDGMSESDRFEIEPTDCDSCDRFEPEMAFPLKCNDILIDEYDRDAEHDSRVGDFAAVSPCDDRFGGKTYLGLYLGKLPLRINLMYSGDYGENVIDVGMYRNPALLVPSLNRVVYGEECWWKFIESPDELQPLDEDIRRQCEYLASVIGMQIG